MRAWTLAAACLLAAACSAGTEPSVPHVDFVVDVDGERFVLRSSDPATVADLRDVLAGRRAGFPIGPLRRGDGGFNAPWSWHLDPAETSVAEVAIEVCDGRPTYVETNLDDFPTYCPWGARIVAER
jgi:hypothetical protein